MLNYCVHTADFSPDIIVYQIIRSLDLHRYDSQLDSARFIGIHKGFINGFGSGAIIGVIYAFYGMVFWYGSKLVRDEQYTPGDMLTVSLLNVYSKCKYRR